MAEEKETTQVFNVEKDWEMKERQAGNDGDPNLNVCESCQ